MLSYFSQKPQPASQSDKQKVSVSSRYPSNRVFLVSTDFKAQQPMDISVKKGELVGIIKEQDPTGSGIRWYIDNGGKLGGMVGLCVKYYWKAPLKKESRIRHPFHLTTHTCYLHVIPFPNSILKKHWCLGKNKLYSLSPVFLQLPRGLCRRRFLRQKMTLLPLLPLMTTRMNGITSHRCNNKLR